MYKITKNHLIGYSLMIVGVVLCVANFIVNCDYGVNFGHTPLYIFSGIISAFGLSFVFREKVEDVKTNNT